MKRLKTNRHILHLLKSSKPKFQKVIIKHCDAEVIKTFCEIALNILKGNCNLSKKATTQLRKYKKELRSLICRKKSINSKRKIIIQRGGFLTTLLGALLSGIIGNFIK